ncbi:PREDICTED: sickle tail protein-like [Cyprinodon variegatus]|uniref:sickle tail protein-like n=1 Tax=Cyprinodon variegatus TaxID=28743 RepID=UPI000742AD20|nr:PREDICTED: sickle tail protein-like [Cyprinodon variegatus]
MLRMAGPELVMLIRDKLAQCAEAAYRQRAAMEEDRIRYLATEEKLLTQISELEDYVDCLRRLSSVVTQPSVTLSDVEEGEVRLRRLGDALAVHRGAFPVLRAKMVSVLRVEVEAVRFLREEPHKMESMLKRVKAQNETLESLRRHLSDSSGSLPKQSF